TEPYRPLIGQDLIEGGAIPRDEFDNRVLFVIAHYKIEANNARRIGPGEPRARWPRSWRVGRPNWVRLCAGSGQRDNAYAKSRMRGLTAVLVGWADWLSVPFVFLGPVALMLF